MAPLTLLLPVTRPWAARAVIACLQASDVPRGRVIVYLDAPGCEEWPVELERAGFTVTAVRSGAPEPPTDRVKRRERHLAMRRATQALVPDGWVLCLEDDMLFPPDGWAHLSAVGPVVSGVQRSRHHGDRRVGVWRDDEAVGVRGAGSGVEPVQACGLYCLLTTGEHYRQPFESSARFGGAIDAAQTVGSSPKVDWGCVCGHLTREGVIMPILKHGDESGPAMFEHVAGVVQEERVGSEILDLKTGKVKKMATPAKVFRTHARVVRDGFVKAGPKQLVPLAKAIAWGLCDEEGNPLANAMYDNVHFVPPTQTKPIQPVQEIKAHRVEPTPEPELEPVTGPGKVEPSSPWPEPKPEPKPETVKAPRKAAKK